MSDEQHEDKDYVLLSNIRERVASGESVYGPIGSPKQVEKLSEVEARLAHGRLTRGWPAAPEPWSVERVAREKLAAKHPFGDPSTRPTPTHLADHYSKTTDALAKMEGQNLARLKDAVAQDLADNPNHFTYGYARYDKDLGRQPSGYEQVRAMLKDAEPAITKYAGGNPEKAANLAKVIAADRALLVRFATEGRSIAAYKARRGALGL